MPRLSWRAFRLRSLQGSPVLALKQHLHSLCGQPRFRQQLVFFHDGVVANVSDEHMLRQGEAQLVLVPFSPASEKQVKELRDAAGSGLASTVEAILQRPQDPDLGQPTPLLVACAHGHLEVVELLLEARADPTLKTTDGYRVDDLALSESTAIHELLKQALE